MVRRMRALAAFLVLATAVPALADEAYDRLLQSYQEAHEKWVAQSPDLGPGKTPPRNPARVFIPKFRDYARQHAGKAAAIPALLWLIDAVRTEPGASRLQPVAEWAIDILRRGHAASPALGPAMTDLRGAADVVSPDKLVAFYEQVRKKNADPETQAAATFNEAYALWSGDGLPADKQRATELFRTVIDDYPASPLVQEARDLLEPKKGFAIGARAPEIVGTDPGGKEIRLSQFKGRVVAVVFWGFW